MRSTAKPDPSIGNFTVSLSLSIGLSQSPAPSPSDKKITSGRSRMQIAAVTRSCPTTAAVVRRLPGRRVSGYYGHLTSVAFPAISTVTRYGYLGVDMFFVISGFVVMLTAWDRQAHEFVISRMVRLYPAYWAAATITAVVELTLGRGRFSVTPFKYVANLTMANQALHIGNLDVVYWTLWAEIRFYLVILMLVWIGITGARVIATMWLWLAATAVIEAHILPAGLSVTIDVLVQSQWSHYFIAGMALCLIYRVGWSWQLGGILVLTYGNAIYRALGFARLVSVRYHQPMHPQVIAAIVTCIFVLLTLVAMRVTRPLARPWMAAAGALTYPLYLVHAYVGFVLFDVASAAVNRWVLLAGVIAIMICTALAIHRLIELKCGPLLRQGLAGLADSAGRALRGVPGRRYASK
jgi:peptidoglycan/LPS O-acetylase OafA/YrhL